MNIRETANRYRGSYIGLFVQIEILMAVIVIIISHDGDFKKYYKTIKSSDIIITDFFNAMDSIKNKIGKDFKDQTDFKLLMDDLRKTRNILAHGTLLITDEEVNNFDGNNVKFINFAYQQKSIHNFSKDDLIDKCAALYFVQEQLFQVQHDVYLFLKSIHSQPNHQL